MGFSSGGAVVWPVPPDWARGVQERLAWGTDVLRASATAVTQHRSYRHLPRRDFEFEVAEAAGDRRLVDMLLAGHGGTWQLPIWPDVQWLSSALSVGATAIPCTTAGYDFVAGGKALLYTSRTAWEVVQVDTVESSQIGLTGATTAAYGPGSRLYPLRRAHVRQDAQVRLRSDDFGWRRLSFEIAEPCEWAALASGTEYLTHPVLEVRPDEDDDPANSYARMLQVVDYGSAPPVVHDLPGIALRSQQSHWKLHGRAEHTWFRSLLYTLSGRQTPIWVPSFTADLQAAAAIAGGSTSLSVEWAGYTLYGKAKHNRKDVRVELTDGTVLYRRITDAVEAGDTETLTLSASLDASSIAPERIRAISFMALSTQGSDETEIDHKTDADGLATATTGWQAVVPDV